MCQIMQPSATPTSTSVSTAPQAPASTGAS